MNLITGLMVAILVVLSCWVPGAYASSSHDYQDLPLAAHYVVSAALGRDNQSYHFSNDNGGLQGRNQAQACDVGFSESGVEINDSAGRWGLSLATWGYGSDQSPVEAAVPTAAGNRVEYRRGVMTEWYVNGPLGLQQGFTLESRPSFGKPGEELRLSLNLAGGLTAVVDPDRRGVSLYKDNEEALARYAGLMVLDAHGREAKAWLEADQDRLSIVVDDRNLDYPLVIDPFIQKAKLTASDGAAGDWFGLFLSTSGDTVVVGACGDDNFKGAAYVFVRPGSNWADVTQSAKLTASDGAAEDWFGRFVSISGDTVVVGAHYDDDNGDASGSAFVFVKPVTGWADMTETAKLTASDGTAGDRFGNSVSISGDTVVIGAYGDDSDCGSAYVFVKPGTGWVDMTQTVKLTATDGAGGDRFGFCVFISSDTVVIGAYGDDSDRGSAYVFEPTGWLWTQSKLTATDGVAGDELGRSVSMSGDTVVIGAYGDDSDRGSAYVFVKPVTGWADMGETAKLTASDGTAGAGFGLSVSISGGVVVAGAFGDDSYRGSAYVFVKPVTGWADITETTKLTASDGAADDRFGYSVSISGGVVVAGAVGDDSYRGSSYVFATQKKTGLSPLNLLLSD